ncbi:MAG: TetR/AcrR family transcriptional regulator [Actinobacteria bacterium]|nr:TetR/AcrR family transcriptional regulator [Actinomycetota bacterium]MCG2800720.1 TetR/AcrR family transcriptional regulator [Cellulomonas sp.]
MAGRTPRQQRGIERRLALIEAAGRAFDRGGYAAAALADIVKDAGSTLGGLGFYFPHKEDLALAVIDEQNSRTFATLEQAGGDFNPLDAMVYSSRIIADQLITDPLVRGGIRLSMELGVLSGPTHGFYDEWLSQVGALFTMAQEAGELVEGGPTPAELAATSVSYFTGVHTVAGVMTGRADLYRRLHVMWQMLIPGMVREESRARLLALAAELFTGPQPDPVGPSPRTDAHDGTASS